MNKHLYTIVFIVIALVAGFFVGKHYSMGYEKNVEYASHSGPGEYETVEVSEGVYSFGDGMVFSMFVVSDTGILIVDPVSTDHSTRMLSAIREVSDLPIEYLVYSHNHWDHESGGAVFVAEGATVLSHVDARDWLIDNSNPEVVLPDEVWRGNKHTITLGNKTVELLHFGASHGEGMTVTYLPEEKIAFIVDIVTPKRVGFTIMPDFDPSEWERTLIEIEKLDIETVLFGHKTATGTMADVTAMREYLQDLRAEIFAMFQRGEEFFAIADTIELPKYKDWEFYDEWLPMNTWRMLMEIGIGW